LFFPARYPRYEPLFGSERYERFLSRNERLRQEVQERTEAEYTVILPPGYSNHRSYPVFISLHGDNSNIRMIRDRWVPLTLGGEFLLAFFQSSQFSGTDRYVWSEDGERSRNEIVELYQRLREEYSIDEEKVIVGGFSSGGALAIDAVLTGRIPAQGFVALCPAGVQVNRADAERLAAARSRGVTGTILWGEEDPFSLDEQEKVAGLLREAGVRYELAVIPGLGHALPHDIGQRLDEALRFIRGRE
jgi:predicted esterase